MSARATAVRFLGIVHLVRRNNSKEHRIFVYFSHKVWWPKTVFFLWVCEWVCMWMLIVRCICVEWVDVVTFWAPKENQPKKKKKQKYRRTSSHSLYCMFMCIVYGWLSVRCLALDYGRTDFRDEYNVVLILSMPSFSPGDSGLLCGWRHLHAMHLHLKRRGLGVGDLK